MFFNRFDAEKVELARESYRLREFNNFIDKFVLFEEYKTDSSRQSQHFEFKIHQISSHTPNEEANSEDKCARQLHSVEIYCSRREAKSNNAVCVSNSKQNSLPAIDL